MKTVTLCADDFGQNSAINNGIIELVKTSKIQAVSVFSMAPCWVTEADNLLDFSNTIDIGLHLNLTEEFLINHNSTTLNQLLLKSHLGLVNKKQIKNQFKKQIDSFIDRAKKLPIFLDGHQHIHGFPIINEALLEVVVDYWPKGIVPYIRDSSKIKLNLDNYLIKKLIIKFACRTLSSQLKIINAPSPTAFYGIYNFDSEVNIHSLYMKWLSECPDGTLLMCHPSAPGSTDPIKDARELEWHYLDSSRFKEACQVNQINLDTFTNYLKKNCKSQLNQGKQFL